MAPSHHDVQNSGYGNDPWIGVNGYSQPGSQPNINGMVDYHGYSYGPNPMPLESNYAMPRPPPYAPAHHPLPPPLVMPHNGVWPSMLASSSNYQTPILPAVPLQTPLSATSHPSDLTPTSAKTPTSRRKLTDDERRQMCLEAELNPTMKQTQIGAKFNVERSTVSKILRQKEKYMKPQVKEESTSPGKKSKVKLPDVEKTLANWACNQQRKGILITTEELRKQVLLFSAGRSEQEVFSSTNWLERFKQKYLAGRSDDGLDSSNSLSETPYDVSPTSSNGLVSPPMSAVDVQARTSIKMKKSEEDFDFNLKETYDDPSSLHQIISHDIESSVDTVISPVSPELHRKDGLAMTLVDGISPSYNYPLQRSQTFHYLNEDVTTSRPLSSDQRTPGLPVRSATSLVTNGSGEDPRQTMKRHKSVPDIHDAEVVRFSSMQPPPVPKSTDISPVSHPGSPAMQDDQMRALYTIKQLLEQRPDVAEPDDYIMIGKLMQKLRLLRTSGGNSYLPGGLHSMETVDSPRLTKKRTIIGISV